MPFFRNFGLVSKLTTQFLPIYTPLPPITVTPRIHITQHSRSSSSSSSHEEIMLTTAAAADDSSDQHQKLIDKLQIFKVRGRDKRGHKILLVVGKFLPARIVSAESLNKYLAEKIFPKLGDRPFSVVYVHTNVERTENFPGISGLRAIYDAIPTAIKENLESVYFLHPGLQARLFLATFGRFLFSGGFYGKLKYVTRLEFLWDLVRRNEIEIPEFVYDHDEALEYRPMMDYGLESDHPRVYGAPTMDSPVSMYSMRCIS